jgi:cell division protein FtsB
MRISFRNVIFAFAMIGGATYGIKALRGYRSPEAVEKRRQIEQLERENEALQRQIEAKKTYLSNLQQNPEEYKLQIQRSLKLVTPGSKNFILQDGKQPDPLPAPERRK